MNLRLLTLLSLFFSLPSLAADIAISAYPNSATLKSNALFITATAGVGNTNISYGQLTNQLWANVPGSQITNSLTGSSSLNAAQLVGTLPNSTLPGNVLTNADSRPWTNLANGFSTVISSNIVLSTNSGRYYELEPTNGLTKGMPIGGSYAINLVSGDTNTPGKWHLNQNPTWNGGSFARSNVITEFGYNIDPLAGSREILSEPGMRIFHLENWYSGDGVNAQAECFSAFDSADGNFHYRPIGWVCGVWGNASNVMTVTLAGSSTVIQNANQSATFLQANANRVIASVPLASSSQLNLDDTGNQDWYAVSFTGTTNVLFRGWDSSVRWNLAEIFNSQAAHSYSVFSPMAIGGTIGVPISSSNQFEVTTPQVTKAFQVDTNGNSYFSANGVSTVISSNTITSGVFVGSGSGQGILTLSNAANTAITVNLGPSNVFANSITASNVTASSIVGTDGIHVLTNVTVGAGLAFSGNTLTTNGQTVASSGAFRLFGTCNAPPFTSTAKYMSFSATQNAFSSALGDTPIGPAPLTISDAVFVFSSLPAGTNAVIVLYTNDAASNFSNSVNGAGNLTSLSIAGPFTIPANANCCWQVYGNNPSAYGGNISFSFKATY